IERREAAEMYFERVLNRRLHLARSNHTHQGHLVFEALCRRGDAPGWAEARLARLSQAPAAAEPRALPKLVAGVADRLALLLPRRGDLSPGNPAQSTREEHGPLYLIVPSGGFEIAEEMSIWDAIVCAPAVLRPLPDPGAAFDAFCSRIIQAVE